MESADLLFSAVFAVGYGLITSKLECISEISKEDVNPTVEEYQWEDILVTVGVTP